MAISFCPNRCLLFLPTPITLQGEMRQRSCEPIILQQRNCEAKKRLSVLTVIACIYGSNKPLYKNENYLTNNHKECCKLKLPEIWHTVQWIFLFLSICSYSHTVLSYSQNQLCCLKQLLCGCHEKVEILE